MTGQRCSRTSTKTTGGAKISWRSKRGLPPCHTPFDPSTTLLGLIAANTYTASEAFVAKGAWEFRAFVSSLAFQAMHNTYDDDNEPRFSRPPVGMSPVRQSPRSAARAHYLIPISCVVGWKGKLQQKCAVCRVNCGFCCAECSGSMGIFPLHSANLKWKGVTSEYPCLALHQRRPNNPDFAA